MEYTAEALLSLFEDKGVIVKINDKYTIATAYKRKLNLNSTEYCTNFPEEFMGISDTVIYSKVIALCEIPVMHSGQIKYVVQTRTRESISILKSMLKDPEFDFDRFVESTKDFYKNDLSVPGFANYLSKDLWKGVYLDYKGKNSKRDRKGII